MKWYQFRIKTREEAEDMVAAMLLELGISGVELEDHLPLTQEEKAQMFIDIDLDRPATDKTAYVRFYLEAQGDKAGLLRKVRENLAEMRTYMDIGEGTLEESETEDSDWVNNWKQYFHSFSIGDILIHPSWEAPTGRDTDGLVVQIDPGTAFGTGAHDTTQLCIRQMRKHIRQGDRVLDMGCGSGILGILAWKLGAGAVVGVDLDPEVFSAFCDNRQVNGIPEEAYPLLIGNLTEDRVLQEKVGVAVYDMVVANILAETLVLLTPVLVKTMKKDALYITGGILAGREAMVTEAMEQAGLTVLETATQGEWVSVTAKK